MTCPAPRPTCTRRSLAQFVSEQRGATAVEYSIMASLIALAIIGTVFSLGSNIQTSLYNKVLAALTGA